MISSCHIAFLQGNPFTQPNIVLLGKEKEHFFPPTKFDRGETREGAGVEQEIIS